MTKKSISRLLQASLMCCLAVLFAACEDFATEDNPIPAYLSINKAPVTLKVGDTFKREAIGVSGAVIEYASSDTDVATVDGEGLVTAIAEGTATITATATGYSTSGRKIYQPASASYDITVKPNPATINTAPVATAGDILAGSTTALVAAGVADGGTMMYQVTTTNTKPTTTDGFSATVPTAATLAAGSYYVWYYAKADAQHSDSEIAATAIEVTVKASYLKWDNTKKELVATLMPDTYTTVESSASDVNWSAGTYVVEGNVTINGTIILNGNVDLIIKDGAKLTVNNFIYGNYTKYNLSIYGQANQTGQLVVNSSSGHAIRNMTTFEVHGCQVTATSSAHNQCGIYGIDTFNVYGGSVDAENTNSSDGYGIRLATNGSMNIYGGDVKAVGKGTCYGISGKSTVTVYGGKLWAEGAGYIAFASNVTLAKDAGFTGKIETSGDGSSWTDWTTSGTPSTKYVRVGY